jgi:hypothetical protein
MNNFTKFQPINKAKNVNLALTILFSLLFQVGQTQEMYLKSVTHRYLIVDTVFMIEEYFYNDNWKIDSVTFTIPFGGKTIQNYRNDTLINEITPENTFEYIYNSDSVIRYNITSDEIDMVYFVDINNKEISCNNYENGNILISYNYTWENENAVLFTNSMGNTMNFTFFSDILNPRYQTNSALKFGQSGIGSINYLSGLTVPDIPIEEFYVVDELLNSYPLIVTEYILTNPPSYRFVFDYYIIDDIQDNISKGDIVQTVKYYNILGQEIPKPKQGLYIERKQTTDGISSRKYFIR